MWRTLSLVSLMLVACGPEARPAPAVHEPAPPSFYSAAWRTPPVEEIAPTTPGPSGFAPQFRIRPGGRVHSAALSPDGYLLAIATDSSVTVWNVAARDIAIRWTAPAETCRLAFSPDASSVLGVCFRFTVGEGGGYTRDGFVLLWRVGSAEPTWSVHSGCVVDGAFSPRGDLVAIHDESAASLLDAATGRLVRRFDALDGGAPSVTFSVDGTLVAVSREAEIAVFATADGSTRAQLASRGSGLRFSPDARALVSATSEGLQLWDVATGRTRWQLAAAGTRTIAFSADGHWLAGEGVDGDVRVWDASDAHLVDTLEGAEVAGTMLTFSTDGRWLAGSFQDVVVVWRRP